MTRYTVVWARAAENDLAKLWTNARDRNAVTRAGNVIDVELSQDAPTKGREVSEGLRVFLAPPLRVLFSVDEGDRLVEVARAMLL